MKGGLQGDFSRFLLKPRKNYAAVYLQQGRVLLDSDWNAQVDLLARRLRTRTRDLVGPSGGPAGDAGYEILAEPRLALDGESSYLTLGGQGFRFPGGAGGFTFEAWISPRPAAGDATLLARFARGEDGRFRRVFTLELGRDGTLRLRAAGDEVPPLVTERRLAPGRFQHVALAYTGEWTALYVDRELAARHLHGGHLEERETLFVLGARVEGKTASAGFDGFLDEVRLWRAALDPEEVGRELGARPDALFGRWRFDRPVVEVEDTDGGGPRWVLGGGRAEHRPGWVTSSFRIGSGRYYVDGVLCENLETVDFEHQPDYPGARLPRPEKGVVWVFYLDAWEQLVTPLQDPAIREVALGGADTTLRSRVVAQVRVLPVRCEANEPADEAVLAEWDAFVARAKRKGRLRGRRVPSAEVLGNLLYRVEIHTSGGLYGWPRSPAGELEVEVESVETTDSGCRLVLREWPEEADPWRAGDTVEAWSDLSDGAGRAGETAAIVAIDRERRVLELDKKLDALAGHPERLRRVATFKWSRHNASVVYAINTWEPKSQVVVVAGDGQGNLSLEPGDWVEVFDDESSLQPRPGPLYRVEDVDDVQRRVTLDAPPALEHGARGPGLRRWDQKPLDGQIFDGGKIVAQHAWLKLEAGIEVFFDGGGPYRARDYWWLPARTLTGDVEWPQRPDGKGPKAVPPVGVGHAYAPLAVLGRGEEGIRLRDCRKTFQPLTDGAVSKAGDTMYGPLVIRSDLTVEGPGLGEPAAVSAGVYYGELGSPDSVGTPNLRDASVTAGKLAAGIGTVPPGYSILGPTPEPPPGYVYTGSSISVPHPTASWIDRALLPRRDPGPLRGAVAGGRLYVFLESGEVWEYDPARDRWRTRCHRPVAGQGFAVAASRGRIYVVGGTDAAGRPTGTTLIYDPASNGWTTGPDLPTPRSRLALASWEGRLYALGGLRRSWFGERASARNEVLDTSAETWARRRPLPETVYDPAAVGAGGRIHLLGGVRRHLFGLLVGTLTRSHYAYQPTADRWRRLPSPLPTPRAHPGLAAIGERIYAIGGDSLIGPLSEVEEHDLETAGWHRLAALPEPAGWPAAGAAGGLLLAVGGEDTPDCPGIPTRQFQAATTFFIHRKAPPREEAVTEAVDVEIEQLPAAAGELETGDGSELSEVALRQPEASAPESGGERE